MLILFSPIVISFLRVYNSRTRCTYKTLYKTVKDRDLQWAVDQHLKQQKQRLSFDRHFFLSKISYLIKSVYFKHISAIYF